MQPDKALCRSGEVVVIISVSNREVLRERVRITKRQAVGGFAFSSSFNDRFDDDGAV